MSDVPASLVEFLDRSNIALCLAKIENGEHPLVICNTPFTALTGYTRAEILNRDCRFLQGPDTDPEDRARMRRFLDRPQSDQIRAPILNYKKSGERFINLVFMAKLRDAAGKSDWIFASQFDISKSEPALLDTYNSDLTHVTERLAPAAGERRIAMNGSLMALGNTAAIIAQARMKIATLG